MKVAHDDGIDPREGRSSGSSSWLDGEEKPIDFAFTTLRRRMTKKEIVRTIKERWKTERLYEEMKGELGFDHFEWSQFHRLASPHLCRSLLLRPRRRRAGRRFDPAAVLT